MYKYHNEKCYKELDDTSGHVKANKVKLTKNNVPSTTNTHRYQDRKFGHMNGH